MGETKLFFHYFIKPRGINTHLNELSERAENQPRPRTFAELKERLKERQYIYIIYDGFADLGALVDRTARMAPGVVKNQTGSAALPAGIQHVLSRTSVWAARHWQADTK